jgi:hypothetical protein
MKLEVKKCNKIIVSNEVIMYVTYHLKGSFVKLNETNILCTSSSLFNS